MIVAVIVIVGLAAGKNLLAEPALHLDGLGVGVEETEVEQERGIDRAAIDLDDRRAGVECGEPRFKLPPGFRRGQVAFGQQQPVGDRSLLHRLDLAVERIARH